MVEEPPTGLLAKIRDNPGSSALVLTALAGGAYSGFCASQGISGEELLATASPAAATVGLGVIVSARMSREHETPAPLGLLFGSTLGAFATGVGYGGGRLGGYLLQQIFF